MRLTLLLTLSLLSFSSILGQNTPSEIKDLNFENYSRQQIRTYLMMIEPESSKVYKLARYSKANRNWSYIFYSLSATSFIGALNRFNAADQASENSILGSSDQKTFGQFLVVSAIAELGLGIWNTHRSHSRLNKALKLYRGKN